MTVIIVPGQLIAIFHPVPRSALFMMMRLNISLLFADEVKTRQETDEVCSAMGPTELPYCSGHML